MSSDLVSVVIPVKNGADTLSELLASLTEQETPFATEVLLVDSGSTDGSQQIASRYPVRLVEIPPQEFNHGVTRNYGIAQTAGSIICLLTQDATPTRPDFLANLASRFDDPHVAGVYGRQIPRPDCDAVNRRNLEGWLTGRPNPANSALGDRRLDDLPPAEQYELCIFDNVCSAVRRSVWETIPFSRVAFGEDIYWGRQVIREGWVIAYEPAAAVYHSHRRSVWYEYTRTRASHAELNRLFDLATLPRLRDLPRAFAYNLSVDIPYVWHATLPKQERLRQLARTAALSFISPLAQHLGMRDAARTGDAERAE